MGVGAVASSLAAERFGLEILQSSIETYKQNYTRFLVLSNPEKAGKYRDMTKTNKASLVLSLPHEEGSLSAILSILSFYKMNLSKIQSLPIIGKEWQYLFYIDVAFDNYKRFHQAINAITPLTHELQNLGEYTV